MHQGAEMQVSSVAEQLFFTTVRIDTITMTGQRGSGTGFFFSHKVGENEYGFIVTNKHVVTDMREGMFTFTQGDGGNPVLGKGQTLKIENWPQAWFGHPSPDVDIAVCPFAPLQDHIKKLDNIDLFFRYISSEMIPNEQQIMDLDAVEPITFIGYPNGIWDSKNLLPVARRGTTASPIEVDFEGTPRFIIDASVFGGSSGSPVFILNQGSYSEKNGALVAGTRLLFVGVIAAVFYRTQFNEVIAVPIPTQNQQMTQTQEMIDLGIVFKAKTVVETVEAFLSANGVQVSAVATTIVANVEEQ